MMEWINALDKMPKLDEDGWSDQLVIWTIEGWEPGEPIGFVMAARYNRRMSGWVADEGTLEDQGFIITHWAAVEPPTQFYAVQKGG